MSLHVISSVSDVSVPISSLVKGKTCGHLSLPGVGSIERVSLQSGETGEIVRLDHHVTFVRKGNTSLFSRHEERDLGMRSVGAGGIHLRPAMLPHSSRWDSPVDVTVVSLEVRYLNDNAGDLFRKAPWNVSLRPAIAKKDTFLCHLGLQLDEVVATGGPAVFAEQIMATMAMHLILTADAGPMRRSSRALSRASLSRTLDYIEANLAADIRLATLAALSGLSVYHFSRQFSREMGVGVARYVQLRRMNQACDLLRRNQLSIQKIAEAAGYLDASSFSRAFRKIHGLSPEAFRRQALLLDDRKLGTIAQ